MFEEIFTMTSTDSVVRYDVGGNVFELPLEGEFDHDQYEDKGVKNLYRIIQVDTPEANIIAKVNYNNNGRSLRLIVANKESMLYKYAESVVLEQEINYWETNLAVVKLLSASNYFLSVKKALSSQRIPTPNYLHPIIWLLILSTGIADQRKW